MTDYREVAITDLADENAELRDSLRSFRELAQAAIAALAAMTIERDRLQRRNVQLLEALRERGEECAA